MYELRCLGEATLRSPSGELVHFRSRKHLALLIYMALNADRAHRRERLAAMLWSDSDESKARHSLSQALYAVRRLLNGAVCIEGDDLELKTDGLYVDALELEQFFDTGDVASAADMYKGDFLEGFWVRGAQGFEEWIFHERARFSALARDALRKAITTARAAADWPEVSARAERLVRLDPFDEAAYSELMRALWMQGDRSAALDRYADLCRVLDSDLKTSPSKETEALASRIRERSVRGGWTSQAMLRETESALFLDPPFVGRKRELAALSKEWSVVSTGESRTVALVGGAGIGKTRLATEFMKSLELDDNTILRGRCYEAEQSLPYGPIAEALRLGLAELDLEDVNPLWLAELARIVPEAHERFGELPEPAELDAEGGRRRLYEGIAQVFRGACDARPILLFVDDLHWADESSLALLHYLHRRVTNGLYLLTAHRPEEVADRSASITAKLLSNASAQAHTIQVGGLDQEESSDLVTSIVGKERDIDTVSELRSKSGGNPLFAIELARNVTEEANSESSAIAIPESIRSLFDRRFSTLSDRAAAMMQQAAFLGSRTSYDVLAAAAGLPVLEVDGVLRQLARVGILTVEENSVSFRHDLIREVASEQVPQAMHCSLHLRAARALIDTNGAAGEIASHFSAAGENTRAFQYALEGAAVAESIFALDEAASLLSLAANHADSGDARIEIIGRLGRLLHRKRDFAQARPLLQERLNFINSGHYTTVEGLQAKRDLLFLDVDSSRLTMKESGQALEKLHTEFVQSKVDNPRFEAEVLHALLWTAARSLDTELVEETIGQIRRLHNDVDLPDVRYSTARSLGIYARYRGQLAEAKQLLFSAIESAECLDDKAAVLDSYIGLSTLPSRSLSAELVNRIESVAIPLAERVGDLKRLAGLLANLAPYYNHKGQTNHCEKLLLQAKRVLEGSSDHTDLSTSITYSLGVAAFMNGDLPSAHDLWKQALAASTEGVVLPVTLEALAGLGQVALRRGDIGEARSLAASSLRLARRARFLADDRFGLEALLAHLRHTAGRKQKAIEELTRIAEEARESDIPLYLTMQITHMELLVIDSRVSEARLIAEEVSRLAHSLDATWWIKRASGVLEGSSVSSVSNDEDLV